MNPRVAALPTFRSIPVPFFVTYRTDGTPDFKVIDERNRMRCAVEKLCWVCGQRLTYWIAFIGGPKSADARLYVDGPMHEECAADALELCPFLVGRMDYAKEIDLTRHAPETHVRHIREMDQKPPEDVYVYKTRGFAMKVAGDSWLFVADRAFSITVVPRRRSHEKEEHA